MICTCMISFSRQLKLPNGFSRKLFLTILNCYSSILSTLGQYEYLYSILVINKISPDNIVIQLSSSCIPRNWPLFVILVLYILVNSFISFEVNLIKSYMVSDQVKTFPLCNDKRRLLFLVAIFSPSQHHSSYDYCQTFSYKLLTLEQ